MKDKPEVFIVSTRGNCEICGEGGIEGIYDNKAAADLHARKVIHARVNSYYIQSEAPKWILKMEDVNG